MHNETLQKSLLAGSTALALLAAAIALSAPAPAGADMSTTTATPASVVLFEDDFATYSGRWQLTETAKVAAAYHEAALRLRVVSPGVFVWSVPDFDIPLRDYRLDVMTTVREGSADSLVGFVVDYQNENNFYALMTTTQGEWSWYRLQEGDWLDLTPADADEVAINSNGMGLALRADVNEHTLAFYINDQLAGRVTVEDGFSGGVFGVIARAGRGYVDVSFDDFEVTTGN